MNISQVEDEEPYSIKAVMPSANRSKTKEYPAGQPGWTEEALDDDSLEDSLDQPGEKLDGTARKLHQDLTPQVWVYLQPAVKY